MTTNRLWPMVLLPDTDLLEFVCNENNKGLRHLNANNNGVGGGLARL